MLHVISAAEAAEMLHDGDSVLFNSFGSLGFPEDIAIAVGKRFKETGSPKNMTYLHNAGLGSWKADRMVEHMSHEGMISCTIGSHITPMIRICDLISQEKIEGYSLPLGVVSHIIRASAGRKPGILTKIGLDTFNDPRYGGCAMNDISKRKLVRLMEIDGEEYLFYQSFKPDICLLRGTTADPSGNITMEKEASMGDAYWAAVATKANGGKVVAQVERLSGNSAHPRLVKIPGILVDAVVVAPGQWQSLYERYEPGYTGEWNPPKAICSKLVEAVEELNVANGRKRERSMLHRIIARRAALQLKPDDLVNLGIGIPEMIPRAAEEMGIEFRVTLTEEAGVIGGVPTTGVSFGAAFSADMHLDISAVIDLYDGGLLDSTFVGALEVDAAGNVNVSLSGKRVIGVGGFTNLTQSAKEVYYCFPFTAGGLKGALEDGKLQIIQEGRHRKFRAKIDQISASARFSFAAGQKVMFITERCVFALAQEGLMLVEIAPGIDLEKDILSNMDFRPIIADQLTMMEAKCFQF